MEDNPCIPNICFNHGPFITGIKTEDGGTWDALVVNSCPNDTVTDMIHTNNSAAVNVNVVGKWIWSEI